MLASDDFIDSGNSLEFSLASDIIELVIFTTDEVFMQTLREAVGGSRRLWHVPSADKVSDMLLAGQVGILVLDVHALTENVGTFIAMIKRQFPDLVLVVAGQRDAESELAALISSGTVYRFIHKPMSPGRAKLFAEAACRKYEERRKRLPVAAGRSASSLKSPGLAAGLAAAVALGVLAAWGAMHRRSADGLQPAATDPAPTAAAARPETPPATAGDSRTPGGPAEGVERYMSQAQIDSRDRLKLAAAKQKSKDPARPAEAAAAGAPAATSIAAHDDRLSRALGKVDAKIKEDHLIEPDYDNARYYIQEALQLDPKGDATLGAKQTLAIALLADAREAIERRDLPYAGRLIDAATGIAAPANIESARQLLKSAQERLVQSQQAASDPAAVPAAAAAAAPAAPVPVVQSPAAPPVTPTAVAAQAAASPPAESQPPPTEIVAAKDLTLVKSVRPQYPPRAEQLRTEGWVELDFTVAENGDVRDVAVHAANPAGVFEKAAAAALAQWRYLPVVKDAKTVAQRSRIRIRFTLPT